MLAYRVKLVGLVGLFVMALQSGIALAQAIIPPFPWGPYPVPTNPAQGPLNVRRTTLTNLPTTWPLFLPPTAAPGGAVPLVRDAAAQSAPAGPLVAGQLVEAFDFATPVAGILDSGGNSQWLYWKGVITTNCAGFASTQLINEDDDIREFLSNPATGALRIENRKALVGSADPVEAGQAPFDTGGKYHFDGPQFAALVSIPVDGIGAAGNRNAAIGFDAPHNGLLNPPVLTPGRAVRAGEILVRKDYLSTVKFITFLYQRGNQLYAIVEWGYNMDLRVSTVGGVLTNQGFITHGNPNILMIAGMNAKDVREQINDDVKLLDKLQRTGHP